MTNDANDDSLDDDSLTEAMDKATYACQDASGGVPDPLDWGAWIYSDAHPAVGGGVGGFVWFESRDDFLAFLHEHLAFLDPGIHGRGDAFALHDACKTVLDAVKNDSLPLRIAMARLNHLVRGLSVIKWWGRMEDLLTGDDSFACEVRCRFRNEQVDALNDAPSISGHDVKPFAEFLGTMM